MTPETSEGQTKTGLLAKYQPQRPENCTLTRNLIDKLVYTSELFRRVRGLM